MKTSKMLSVLWDYFVMTVGTFVFVMAWTSFLQPNNLASGGLTGFSTILDYATQGRIPMDVTYALLNVLLLVAGFLFLGRAFGFKTIYVIALSSLLFWLLPEYFPQLEVVDPELDKIMVVLIGGAMESVGIGMILLRGGSTGGTDIVAMMFQKYCKMTFSQGVLIADSLVVLAGLTVIGFGKNGNIVEALMLSFYSLIAIFISSRVLSYMLDGASYDRIIFIITEHHNEEFRKFILEDLERSGTYIKSSGMYTNSEKEMIFLVVPRHELTKVQRAIKEYDPKAFMVVANAYNTFGEGFKPMPEKHELENM